jgi:hemerythrin-like domain-containing protein
MTRCVTDYLVQEHQELSHLLSQLQEQLRVLPLAREHRGTAERLQGLTRKISKTLHAHFVEEEQILYPALEGHVQGITATLQRMRMEHDTGQTTERAFFQSIDRLTKSGRNRQEVIDAGLSYVQWLRKHLLEETGRLFPMVDRGLDIETQMGVRRAMEELTRETTARVPDSTTSPGQA